MGSGLIIYIVYSGVLIALAVIDLRKRIIPNVIVYPSMGLALALSPLLSTGLLNSVFGGLVGIGVIGLLYILSGYGMGDIKMAGLVGLMVGFPMVGLSLFISVVVGAIAAVILITRNLLKRTDSIPFAPFLAGGAIITLVWGGVIWRLF